MATGRVNISGANANESIKSLGVAKNFVFTSSSDVKPIVDGSTSNLNSNIKVDKKDKNFVFSALSRSSGTNYIYRTAVDIKNNIGISSQYKSYSSSLYVRDHIQSKGGNVYGYLGSDSGTTGYIVKLNNSLTQIYQTTFVPGFTSSTGNIFSDDKNIIVLKESKGFIFNAQNGNLISEKQFDSKITIKATEDDYIYAYSENKVLKLDINLNVICEYNTTGAIYIHEVMPNDEYIYITSIVGTVTTFIKLDKNLQEIKRTTIQESTLKQFDFDAFGNIFTLDGNSKLIKYDKDIFNQVKFKRYVTGDGFIIVHDRDDTISIPRSTGRQQIYLQVGDISEIKILK